MQDRASPAAGLRLAGSLAILAALAGACASSNTENSAGIPRPSTPASMGRPVAEAPEEAAAVPPARSTPPGPSATSSTASTAPPAAPAPTASTAAPAPRTSKTSRGIIDTALSLRGVQYRAGGADPKGFDCSGFTKYVFGKHGIDLPRSAIDQYHAGKPVKRRDLASGDLLFFRTVGNDATHVAIAVDEERMVHAPSSNGVVRVESIETMYWASRYLGARRMR